MDTRLQLDMLHQPDETTCGPTSLHAVYNFYGDGISLDQVIAETDKLTEGGTLAVMLACHALRRGYQAKIYTFNLQVFDPTWFRPGAPPLREKLLAQMASKSDAKLQVASRRYLEFLELGGRIRMEDLSSRMIRKYLTRQIPILTGLSSTYLYQEPREREDLPNQPLRFLYDDVAGYPGGHFVVLCGYDATARTVLVADPLHGRPLGHARRTYDVPVARLRCAILLGILTYDANLLIIHPPDTT